LPLPWYFTQFSKVLLAFLLHLEEADHLAITKLSLMDAIFDEIDLHA
jgi:hypothetical protein